MLAVLFRIWFDKFLEVMEVETITRKESIWNSDRWNNLKSYLSKVWHSVIASEVYIYLLNSNKNSLFNCRILLFGSSFQLFSLNTSLSVGKGLRLHYFTFTIVWRLIVGRYFILPHVERKTIRVDRILLDRHLNPPCLLFVCLRNVHIKVKSWYNRKLFQIKTLVPGIIQIIITSF